jgi:hypothetical protein
MTASAGEIGAHEDKPYLSLKKDFGEKVIEALSSLCAHLSDRSKVKVQKRNAGIASPFITSAESTSPPRASKSTP